MTNPHILDFLRTRDLDVRNFHFLRHREASGISPRFIDQKVTPDVLNTISRTVVELMRETDSFTVRRVWHSEAFKRNVKRFNKPAPDEPTARSEYNKFVGQPLKALAFAGVLTEAPSPRGTIYAVNNESILRFIAGADENAALFIIAYVQESLRQSGLLPLFEEHRKSNHTPEAFLNLKSGFASFLRSYTKLKSDRDTEANRMFPKVLNPLATHWVVPGARAGRVDKFPKTFADLMYNDVNWRDRGHKAKNHTRAMGSSNISAIEDTVVASQVTKAKNEVMSRHDRQSEINDAANNSPATQVHHIVPSRARVRATRENLIALTPDQHFYRAHPGNDTTTIDLQYQLDLLIAKSLSIESSCNSGDGFYKKSKFLEVVGTVIGREIDDEATFDDIRMAISDHRFSTARPSMA